MVRGLDPPHSIKWRFVKCMDVHQHVENSCRFVTMEKSYFSALENVMDSMIVLMVLTNGAVLKNAAALLRFKARSTNLVSLYKDVSKNTLIMTS